MTADEVMAALRAQNLQVAGGALGQPPQPDMGAFQMSLQLKGRLLKPAEFENIVLKTGADGRVVRVKDVGRVELGALSYTTYGYQDDFPATVMPSRSSRAPTPSKRPNAIKAEMERLSERFPKGSNTASSITRPSSSRPRSPKLYRTIIEAVVPGRRRRAAVPADVAGDDHPAASPSPCRSSAPSRSWRRWASPSTC